MGGLDNASIRLIVYNRWGEIIPQAQRGPARELVCFRLQVHHHYHHHHHQAVGLASYSPGGYFAQRFRAKGSREVSHHFGSDRIGSDRIIRWQPVRWVRLVAGLHNSINMKVIVTAIRSIRDYWIHSSIHPTVPTAIHPLDSALCFLSPFTTSSSVCEDTLCGLQYHHI